MPVVASQSGEQSGRHVQASSRHTRRTDVSNLSDSGVSISSVGDGHPFPTKVGRTGLIVGPPSRVDGNDVSRVRVVVSTCTGVTVLVEVSGGTVVVVSTRAGGGGGSGGGGGGGSRGPSRSGGSRGGGGFDGLHVDEVGSNGDGLDGSSDGARDGVGRGKCNDRD